MSATILEALQNARHYLGSSVASIPAIKALAMGQLNNAVELLEKGYGLYEEVEPLLEKYGSVDDVPEKDDK